MLYAENSASGFQFLSISDKMADVSVCVPQFLAVNYTGLPSVNQAKVNCPIMLCIVAKT